jgi:hypothetical protein
MIDDDEQGRHTSGLLLFGDFMPPNLTPLFAGLSKYSSPRQAGRQAGRHAGMQADRQADEQEEQKGGHGLAYQPA